MTTLRDRVSAEADNLSRAVDKLAGACAGMLEEINKAHAQTGYRYAAAVPPAPTLPTFTPGPMAVDNNTDEIPFRVYSNVTQGTVGLFYSEADAELFAAAPDLLGIAKSVAAIGFHKIPDSDTCLCSRCSLVREARAAIAKAEGL